MTARAFVIAWESGDRRAMYRLVAPRSRPAHGYPAFAAAYVSAQTTAGLRSVHRAAPMRVSGGAAQVPMEARTQLFGALTGTLRIPLVEVARRVPRTVDAGDGVARPRGGRAPGAGVPCAAAARRILFRS